jgi:hypothetical protein
MYVLDWARAVPKSKQKADNLANSAIEKIMEDRE